MAFKGNINRHPKVTGDIETQEEMSGGASGEPLAAKGRE
jgi:hypothetical protein